MKVYVASSFENKAEAHDAIRQLRECGYTVLLDWTTYPAMSTEEDAGRIGALEAEAVRASDVLVLLLPGEVGSHVEFGIAMGMRKPIVVVGKNRTRPDGRPVAFYFLPGVHLADSITAAIGVLGVMGRIA